MAIQRYSSADSTNDFYAGEIFIPTGLNDPVAWTQGLPAAEVYAARVYAAGGSSNYSAPPNGFQGTWRVVATPVWSRNLFFAPAAAGAAGSEIFISCRCFSTNPAARFYLGTDYLTQLDWGLYRI